MCDAAPSTSADADTDIGLRSYLGDYTIFLYGDSINVELKRYLETLNVNVDSVAETAAKPKSHMDVDDWKSINAQIFDKKSFKVKPNIESKLRMAGIIVLSAGKNIMSSANRKVMALHTDRV